MIARPLFTGLTALFILGLAETAVAQLSRLDLGSGYQYTRTSDQTQPIGWSADITTNLKGGWSVVAEVSGAYRTEEDEDLGVAVRLSVHCLGAGPRWSSRLTTRMVPFVQVLAGAARVGASADVLDTKVGDSSTRFMLQPGGGVDLRVYETLRLVGQLDYRRVILDEDTQSGKNQLRAFVGVRVGL